MRRNSDNSNRTKEYYRKIDNLNIQSEEIRSTDYSKSLEYAKAAAKLSREKNYKSGLAEAFRNIAVTKSWLSDFKSAITYLNKSQKLFSSIGDLNSIAKVYNIFGIISRRKGNYFKAVEYYKKSLKIHKSAGDKKGEAICLNNLGYAYTSLGDYLNSLNYHFDAYKIFQEIKYKLGEASSLTNLALIYKELGDYESDLKYEQKSLRIKKEVKDVRGVSNSLVNIGNTYTRLENFNKAIQYFEEALKLKIAIEDFPGKLYATIGLANAYIKTGLLDDADKLLKLSLKEAKVFNSKSDEVMVLITISSYNLKIKNYKTALELQKKALNISTKRKFKEYIYKIHDILSDTYKETGDYKHALYHKELFIKFKNEILSEQSINKIKNLQILHEVETADKEIEYQKLKNTELANALTELTAALDVSDIISRSDLDGKIKYVNSNLVNISGYSSEELIGSSYYIFWADYHSPEFFKELWDTINAGNVWKGEIKNRRKDGSFFWIHTTIVPIFDDKKTPVEFLLISNDITERKEAEEKLFNQYNELETTNEELDNFVYSVSHDLRAPLTSILGVLNVVADEVIGEDVKKYLSYIRASVDKLDNTVRDIIDYSRNSRTQVRFKKIKINRALDKALSGLTHLENFEKVKIIREFDQSDSIITDEYRLILILKNLLANSIKFCKLKSKNPYVKISFFKSNGKYALTVEDNGVGIEDEKIPYIFNQFYKATENTHGTGLGLYITKLAVKRLKGDIKVISNRGRGSTFKVTIPVGKK